MGLRLNFKGLEDVMRYFEKEIYSEAENVDIEESVLLDTKYVTVGDERGTVLNYGFCLGVISTLPNGNVKVSIYTETDKEEFNKKAIRKALDRQLKKEVRV
jgi:hypothetical protein